MLMDMLGILIGFVAVILLLSLIVTAVVQVIESIVHVRARNLKRGLAWLFERHLAEEPGAADRNPTELADRLIDRTGKRSAPFNVLGRTVNQPVTWIEPDDLVHDLDSEGIRLDDTQAATIKREFERIGDSLSKRFTQEMRVITTLVALVVAFLFQVSAPGLLRSLSVDPGIRAAMIATGEQLGGEVGDRLQQSIAYENVSDAALRQLQERHPALADQIEEAAGIGDSEGEIVAELRLILCEEVPDSCNAVVDEYEAILDGLHTKALTRARATAEEATAMLAQVNVVPWPWGLGFYRDMRNVGGVVVTIILLSMGAPFWFEVLRNLLKFRDVLQPKNEEKKP
jgi:hypothetical protein